MSRLHRRPQPAASPGRGFSLLELVVAALILVAFVLGAARLLVGLGDQGAGAVESLVTDRTLTSAAGRMEDDFLAAHGCLRSGVDGAVTSLTASQVQLFSDPDANGVADVVVLRVRGGQLERFVLPAGDCATEPAVDLADLQPEVLLTGLSPGLFNGGYFTGRQASGARGSVDCTAVDGCDTTAVRFAAVVIAESGATLDLDRTWQVGGL